MCVLSCLSSGHSPNAITITTGSRCHPELLLVRSPWEKGLILSPRRRERPAWARAARVPEGSEPAGVAGSLGRCVGKGSAGCLFWTQSVQPLLQPWPCTLASCSPHSSSGPRQAAGCCGDKSRTGTPLPLSSLICLTQENCH